MHEKRSTRFDTQLPATGTSRKWLFFFFFASVLLEFLKICMYYLSKFLEHNLLKRKSLNE